MIGLRGFIAVSFVWIGTITYLTYKQANPPAEPLKVECFRGKKHTVAPDGTRNPIKTDLGIESCINI